jgi:iron(III) transport system substrate-binding protein
MEAKMNLRKNLFAIAAASALLAAITTLSKAHAQQVALQFYTSVPRELSEPLAKRFTELNPGIEVNLYETGVETLLQKMSLEVRATGRTQADVMWIEEPAAMKKFADDGLLEPYAAKELEKVLPEYRDPQGRFVANYVALVLLMYNSNKLNVDTAPKSWKDLTDSRFANQLIFANPRVSGTGATFAAAMVQLHGWKFWESIAKLNPILVSGSEGMTSIVIQGERLVCATQNYNIDAAMAQKQPVNFVVPAEGAVALPAYFAIAHGTPKMEAAKKFYDFMISSEAAALLSKQGMFNTRPDLPGPANWPNVGKIKTIAFDWAEYARSKSEIKAKFAELMEK